MMSARGSRPKISSESWTEPAALPSRVVTFSSISRALRLGRRFRSLLGAGRDQRVFRHAEFCDLALGLDLGDGELAALGLRHIDGLAGTRTELQRDIAVLLGRAMAQHLAIAELEHGHGDMFAGLRKDPRHPDLLCDHSGAHRRASCSFCPLTSDDPENLRA